MKHLFKRINGAVSKKTLLPILTHIAVRGYEMTSSTGYITVGTPCREIPLDFCVPAAPFEKAVEVCGDEPKLTLVENHLLVRSGKTRVSLPLGDLDSYPVVEHLEEGWSKAPPDLIERIKLVRPFVGTDAFRMWSHGVLVNNDHLWATNNVVLARSYLNIGNSHTATVWPSVLLDFLLAFNDSPTMIATSKTLVEFAYADGTWVQGSLLEPAWPDVERFFDPPWDSVDDELGSGLDDPLVDGLGAAVEAVAPFCGETGTIVLTENGVETQDGEYHAAVALEGLPATRFRLEPLQAVLRVATELALAKEPPHRWRGPGISGVITPLAR